MAFDRRLVITWTSRSKSTSTGGRPGATARSMATPRLAATAAIPSTATATKAPGRCSSR